jgi:hypothetical protein
VEYANVDVLRRMAMHAQQLARSIDSDQLFSESWLIEQVTGVRSRGADTTASLVGSAVIDDLAALAIRFTDRAPMDAALAPGGAFTLEQAAKKLGVGVRSIQRWRRFGLISMRFQFGRTRRIGCAGAVIEWFEKRHPELLTKVKRPAPTQQARHKLLPHAKVIAAGGGTLNAAAVALAVHWDSDWENPNLSLLSFAEKSSFHFRWFYRCILQFLVSARSSHNYIIAKMVRPRPSPRIPPFYYLIVHLVSFPLLNYSLRPIFYLFD